MYISIILATIISLIATPIVIKVAKKCGIVDTPKGGRKIHKEPIPLIGGVAIYVAFVLTIFLKKGPLNQQEIFIIIGATIITLGGIWDDVNKGNGKSELTPKAKFLVQIIAALILVVGGFNVERITNPFSDSSMYLNIDLLSIPFTMIWIIGVTNAFNFIDGLDGLSAGIGFISSFTIMVVALMNSRMEAALMTGVLCGSLLGVLPFNFNPAKIFIGDTGALLIGYLLAAISIQGSVKSAATVAIAVPILALGLPIYDTLIAMLRRKINGKPMSQGDRGHVHHRLIDSGLSQKQAVLRMYLGSAILGAIAIFVMQVSNKRAYFILATVVILIFLSAWKFKFFKKENR